MNAKTKSFCYFLIFLVLVFNSLLAKSQVLVGVKGGWTSCMPSFQPQVQMLSTIDATTFGLVSVIQKERNVALRLELNYINKGWDELVSSRKIDSSFQLTHQMRGIEFPIFANFILGKGNLKLHFLAGIYFTFYLQQESQIKSSLKNLTSTQIYKKNIENSQFNPVEVGISVGAGLSYDLPKLLGRLQTDIRFNKGLTNAYNLGSNRKLEYSQLDMININLSYLYFISEKTYPEPIEIKED